MKTAVITGASSGLGSHIKDHLQRSGYKTINWSLETGVDVTDSVCIRQIGLPMLKGSESIDVLINCAGINYIEFLPKLKEEEWDIVMKTNAKGIYLVTQNLLPWLSPSDNSWQFDVGGKDRCGTIVNIISNASHMPMTSSLAYNASKGAAEIMTRQMSRELIKTHGITVFGISPNKLSGTGMSRYIDAKVCELRDWTPQQAREYQLASLPAGEETNPATLAEFISFLLSSKQRHKYLAGCIIPYGL